MDIERVKRLITCEESFFKTNKFTHASNPIAIVEGHLLKVYFNSRDEESRAHVIQAEFIINEDFKLNKIHGPIFSPGVPGDFDDAGCSLGCVIPLDNNILFYYLGWNLCKDVPFRNAIGIFSLGQDELGDRKFDGPILDRSIYDPYSLSYPFILRDGDEWKMWYGSHKKWGKSTNDMIHVLKFASSSDGIKWNVSDHICIDNNSTDIAFSRPYVIKKGDFYEMLYSYRGNTPYKIGYASSKDGLNWVRNDAVVKSLQVSPSTWDSEMQCYPFVFDYLGQAYLLYNGNGYGKSGLGVAKIQK